MLSLNGIDKSYGKNHALIRFTYDFGDGIYALLGPNGSGKSTLMNIITGNLRPDEGEILLDGVTPKKMGAEYYRQLGFMPQYTGLYPNFSIEEMLCYMAKLKGVGKTVAQEEIESLLSTVELLDCAGEKISALSGGMRQRLSLVQALIGAPKTILLDEPTAGLDPKQRIIVRNLISQYALHHTVLIATHVVSDVESTAREAIFLRRGEIRTTGTPVSLATAIEGKIWEITVSQDLLPSLQQKYRILNFTNTGRMLHVRVISDQVPEEPSQTVPPTLEDRYLYEFDDILPKRSDSDRG